MTDMSTYESECRPRPLARSGVCSGAVIALVSLAACFEGPDYTEDYERARQEGLRAGQASTYQDSRQEVFDGAFRNARNRSYKEKLDALAGSGTYNQDPVWLAVLVGIGTIAGFVCQYLLVRAARVAGYLTDLDKAFMRRMELVVQARRSETESESDAVPNDA
ncbi:MAG: hypothetical protein GKS06_13265 [Acidobacteria bacterium]|nr:hypothetical protein [Acidobacteriota bacterium]